jgi:hypothetical protein
MPYWPERHCDQAGVLTAAGLEEKGRPGHRRRPTACGLTLTPRNPPDFTVPATTRLPSRVARGRAILGLL